MASELTPVEKAVFTLKQIELMPYRINIIRDALQMGIALQQIIPYLQKGLQESTSAWAPHFTTKFGRYLLFREYETTGRLYRESGEEYPLSFEDFLHAKLNEQKLARRQLRLLEEGGPSEYLQHLEAIGGVSFSDTRFRFLEPVSRDLAERGF